MAAIELVSREIPFRVDETIRLDTFQSVGMSAKAHRRNRGRQKRRPSMVGSWGTASPDQGTVQGRMPAEPAPSSADGFAQRCRTRNGNGGGPAERFSIRSRAVLLLASLITDSPAAASHTRFSTEIFPGYRLDSIFGQCRRPQGKNQPMRTGAGIFFQGLARLIIFNGDEH
jgi:hypothetical protein